MTWKWHLFIHLFIHGIHAKHKKFVKDTENVNKKVISKWGRTWWTRSKIEKNVDLKDWKRKKLVQLGRWTKQYWLEWIKWAPYKDVVWRRTKVDGDQKSEVPYGQFWMRSFEPLRWTISATIPTEPLNYWALRSYSQNAFKIALRTALSYASPRRKLYSIQKQKSMSHWRPAAQLVAGTRRHRRHGREPQIYIIWLGPLPLLVYVSLRRLVVIHQCQKTSASECSAYGRVDYTWKARHTWHLGLLQTRDNRRRNFSRTRRYL